MSDLIDRQAAITSFRLDDDGEAWSMEDIIYRLEQFPSAQPEILACGEGELIAQPERKTGRWIYQDDRREVTGNDWYCSECGNGVRYQDHYCSNCGAKMEVEHERR